MLQQTKKGGYAVAYIRYSSDNQDENSVQYQHARIAAYCIQNGITLCHEYIDRAYTGTNDKRPEFQRMIADAQKHPQWNKILIFSSSRFFRNSSEAQRYRDFLENLGIDVISITQNFDNSPEGRLMENVIFSLDGFYSEINSVNTHAGMTEKARLCNHCGGVPPLGYDVDSSGHLVINEEEANIVRRIFDMYESDISYNRMAKILNQEHCKTKRGEDFTKNSFHSILHQEKYTGLYLWNKARKKDCHGKHNSHAYKPEDEQVRIDNGCPQIISKEQFLRVQEKMASRSNGTALSKRRYHYMLSGLQVLKCTECGSYMIGASRSSHGRKYTIYYCPNHKTKSGCSCPTKEINASELEQLVARLIAADVYHRKDWQEIVNELNHDDKYTKLLNKKRGLDVSTTNLIKAITRYSSPELTDKLRSISDEKKAIEEELERCKTHVTTAPSEHKRICKALIPFLIESDDYDVRMFLKTSLKEILVDNDNVTITLNIA